MVTVYYVMKHEIVSIDVPSEALLLVPEDERESILKKTNTESRTDTLIGRIFLRRILYDRFGISSDDTAIETSPTGKPYLRDHANLHFSISHTKNCIACAVGEIPLGIDVEMICDKVHSGVAMRMFTDGELKAAEQSLRDFFRIWTMKESFVKMTGEGIFGSSRDFDVLSGDGTNGAKIISLKIPNTEAHLCLKQADEISLTEIFEL